MYVSEPDLTSYSASLVENTEMSFLLARTYLVECCGSFTAPDPMPL